jgi:alpha-tubulin suppressor-like RCC1 family protein
VKCWGNNNEAQLGDGNSITSSEEPVDAQGLGSGVSSIAAGRRHTCALLQEGTVKCWGAGALGQLGQGLAQSSLVPTQVKGLSRVKAIAAGQDHSCALLESGGVECWGSNNAGQLGNDSPMMSLVPKAVTSLNTPLVAVAAGGGHTCGITVSGGVKCWGDGSQGQLGSGAKLSRSLPVDTAGLKNKIVEIGAGSAHTCARTIGGRIKCWGSSSFGQLGDSSHAGSLTPVDVIGF